MNGIQLREKPHCKNEESRNIAHKWLDEVLDNTDSVKGWFGTIGIEILVADGQFANLQKLEKQTRKLN